MTFLVFRKPDKINQIKSKHRKAKESKKMSLKKQIHIERKKDENEPPCKEREAEKKV